MSTGEWPGNSTPADPELGICFHTINTYFMAGGRGLPGGSSLHEQCVHVASMHGLAPPTRKEFQSLSLDAIEREIARFHAARDRKPRQSDGDTSLGYRWSTISKFLRREHGITLKQLVDGQTNGQPNVPPNAVTIADIENECRRFGGEHDGAMPMRNSGPSSLGLSFKKIDSALKR